MLIVEYGFYDCELVNVVVAAAITIYFSGCDGDDDEHNQHYDHGEDERLRPRLKTALVVET